MKHNEKNSAKTRLFLLMSVDGKISSGESDVLASVSDWKRINGVKEGLVQYYQIKQTTDLPLLITGKVLAKLCANEQEVPPKQPAHSSFLNSIILHLGEYSFCSFLSVDSSVLSVIVDKLSGC